MSALSTALAPELFPANEMLPALLAASPAGVLLLLPVHGLGGEVADFSFAYLNPAAQRHLGLAAQPIGTVLQLYPQLLGGGRFAFLREALAATHPGPLERSYPAQPGLPSYQLTAQRVGQGLLVSFVAGPPVQSHPAAEAALRESQGREQATRAEAERQRRQWEQLFRRAPAAICIFGGPEWVYEFVNPGYQAMFPGRELLGKRLVDALPEVAGQPLMNILRHVYDTGETFEGKAVLVPLARTSNGPIENIYFDLTYQARYNDEGQIDGFVTYAYDVTEQVLARRQREQYEAKLHHLYEQAPVAIAIFRGPQYVIELANPAACAIWGRTPQQALGQPLFELLPEAAGQGFEQLLSSVMETGVPYVAHELPSYIDRHGRRDKVYWNFVYQPLAEAGGTITGVTVVATEVTDQVLARRQVQRLNEELATKSEELATINEELFATNEELNTANHQLTRTNADLDAFLHTTSHDLSNPVATITNLLLAVRRELPLGGTSSQLPALLDLLQEATERLQHTLRQFTDVSRLQTAREPAAAPVPLAQVLRQVLHELEATLAHTGAQLEVLVPEVVTVALPEKNLRSIFYNLLSNALKFRHPERPPRIRISYWPQQEYQGISVQDNGLGLNAQQARQFAMFQRQHPHLEGSGVGLYIVNKILENVGGSLDVQSQPGQGSIFSVYFRR